MRALALAVILLAASCGATRSDLTAELEQAGRCQSDAECTWFVSDCACGFVSVDARDSLTATAEAAGCEVIAPYIDVPEAACSSIPPPGFECLAGRCAERRLTDDVCLETGDSNLGDPCETGADCTVGDCVPLARGSSCRLACNTLEDCCPAGGGLYCSDGFCEYPLVND